jgi:hypothetical protein
LETSSLLILKRYTETKNLSKMYVFPTSSMSPLVMNNRRDESVQGLRLCMNGKLLLSYTLHKPENAGYE